MTAGGMAGQSEGASVARLVTAMAMALTRTARATGRIGSRLDMAADVHGGAACALHRLWGAG